MTKNNWKKGWRRRRRKIYAQIVIITFFSR
jgi:hypothetical protein